MLGRFVAVLSAVTFAIAASSLFARQSCDSLASLKLSRTTVTAATVVPTGQYKGTGDPNDAANFVCMSSAR